MTSENDSYLKRQKEEYVMKIPIKKGTLLALVFGSALLLSSCKIETDYTLSIKRNGKASLSATLAMDDQMLNLMKQSDSDSENTDTWEYLEGLYDNEEGFTYERYEDDYMKGYTITTPEVPLSAISSKEPGKPFYFFDNKKSDVNDETSTEEEAEVATGATSNIAKEFLNNAIFTKKGFTYTSNLNFASDMSEFSQYSGMFDMKFIVNLPVKADSSNATSVKNDGKTLEWKLSDMKDPSIDFTFTLIPIWLIIVCVVVAVALIAVILLVVLKVIKSKKQNYQY
jgi:hypothetical protein